MKETARPNQRKHPKGIKFIHLTIKPWVSLVRGNLHDRHKPRFIHGRQNTPFRPPAAWVGFEFGYTHFAIGVEWRQL